jgi:hypothetical protein
MPTNNMKKIITILAIALCAACSHKLLPPATSVTSDSTVTNTVIKYKDSIITIPGAKVVIHDTAPCNGGDTVIIARQNNLTGTYTRKGNKATVTCEADSLQQVITWLSQQLSTVTRLKQQTVTQYLPGTVTTVYKTPAWCKWLLLANVLFALYYFRHGIVNILGLAIEKGAKIIK